ncbi:hypothetical protein BD769DRAFT_1388564 [Suillus cothurnatus]|nr:hypothetical protein BD769DRAFT_1388564 [Suillus cothurnatus]
MPMEWDPNKFKPMAPQLCQRYKGRVLVRSDIAKPIPAKKKDFSEAPVDGWENVVHPEGAVYFYDATRDFDEPISIYEHVKGVKCDTHISGCLLALLIRLTYKQTIEMALEAQYWFVDRIVMHCELYPSNAPIRPQIPTELKHVLLHARSDFLTSDTSVVPYDLSTLQSMLDLSINLVEYHSFTYTPEARLMRLFARSKFLNFYGQVSARLNANQHTPTKAANAFLWGAPAAQYKFLQNTWVDNILNYPKWSKHISRLNGDWSNVTIFSTVMLAVDVSFLAVPGVISTAVVAIFLSAMCSVSSLVASMLLAVECRGWGTDSAKGAASFMARMIHTQSDVEALAIMYSLPYASLIWA